MDKDHVKQLCDPTKVTERCIPFRWLSLATNNRGVMKDKNTGIYDKFTVARTDGKSAPGKKHEGCRYFVLDLDHDPFALPAIEAYSLACKDTYPTLAEDLRATHADAGNKQRSLFNKPTTRQ